MRGDIDWQRLRLRLRRAGPTGSGIRLALARLLALLVLLVLLAALCVCAVAVSADARVSIPFGAPPAPLAASPASCGVAAVHMSRRLLQRIAVDRTTTRTDL